VLNWNKPISGSGQSVQMAAALPSSEPIPTPEPVTDNIDLKKVITISDIALPLFLLIWGFVVIE
jgi:hypothetical protein